MGNMQKLTKALLGATALTLYSTGTAFAAGTAAGTDVDNTFTLDYEVSGVAQIQIDNTAAPATFRVDRYVDLIVDTEGDVFVAPGSTGEQLIFSLENEGNGTQAYDLTLGVDGTDDFDANAVTITYYYETDQASVDAGTATFDPLTDGAGTATVYTAGATTDIPADALVWIVVEGDISLTEIDGDVALYELLAETVEPVVGGIGAAGVPVVASTSNVLLGQDVVFGDGAGTGTVNGDVVTDAAFSSEASYIIAAANLDADKAVAVINQDGTGCDSFATTATAGAYTIPGACVEYTITVVNSGNTAATNVALFDDLKAELLYQHAEYSVFTTTSASAFTIDGTAITSAATPVDCATANCEIDLTDFDLAANSTGTLKIRALVQ